MLKRNWDISVLLTLLTPTLRSSVRLQVRITSVDDPRVINTPPHIGFQMQNGHIYQAATTALSVEEQTALMEIMRIAETQSAPIAA